MQCCRAIKGCSITVKQKNGPLPMKRRRAGIQIITKVTITLASGKKQVISVTVQKTTVRTTKITGKKKGTAYITVKSGNICKKVKVVVK